MQVKYYILHFGDTRNIENQKTPTFKFPNYHVYVFYCVEK